MAAGLFAASAVMLTMSAASADAAPASQAIPHGEATVPTTVALVETWPDGRINYELTSPRRATMWTPTFPRVDGFKPEGANPPVYAVQFVRTLVGREIQVEVSVLLGTAQPPAVPVATVSIAPGSHVVIDGLTRFGVQPVTLSMIDVAPMTPYLPTAFSVSRQIEIAKIDLLTAPYPGYRITLRNLGQKAVSNVHIQSYRGTDKALSALKRTDDGRPMMKPGESYTFDMNLTSGGADGVTTPSTWTPRPIDLIEFDSVRWDDGTYDGQPPYPQADRAIESDSGTRLQLRRIVDALRATLAEPGAGIDLLAVARRTIAALPDAEPDQLDAAKLAMRGVKAAVLADIARFVPDQTASRQAVAAVEWLRSALRRYEAWLTRLSPP